MIQKPPPMREDPFGEEETRDGKRCDWAHELWENQTWALQYRDRQVEENVRMLAGHQWDVFSTILNKWVDVSRFLTDSERRWRQRPVVNRLLYWYMLTHARMTENPPVASFQPATGDRYDAMLAEVLDTVHKSLWKELEMLERFDSMAAWMIPGGCAYMRTRIDPSRGPKRSLQGPAAIPGMEGQGEMYIPDAPYGRDGNPMAQATGENEYETTGDPYAMPEGMLEVCVHGPLEIRSSWNSLPFHRKNWHMLRQYLTPEQVYDAWGVEIEPDTTGTEAQGAGQLQRMLFGAGYFGSAGNQPGSGGYANMHAQELVCVNELWVAPTTMDDEMENGRLMVTTKTKCIQDGPRPFNLQHTSPIHRFDFVNLPGRPHGTTPQEMLNPIQRAYNRGWAQMLEHRNLVANPIQVIDGQSGIEESQMTNKPGLQVTANRRPGVAPLEFVAPPPLSQDVYRAQDSLEEQFDYLGNTEGTQGQAPTRDASGELVKELRFNTDRFIGPTMRRAALTMGRVINDWMAMLPVIWDEQKIIAYAGDDNIVRTVTVTPDMWDQGSVNVHVDVESMLPEGRGERQTRIYRMYADGLLGPPGSPEARKTYFDLANFPHMGRAARPGGVHRSTAEQENGRLVQGELSQNIPIFEWYDDQTHIWIHEEFMASPEYLKLDPMKQQQFAEHWIYHKQIFELKMQEQAMKEAQVQAILAPPEAQNGETGKPAQGEGGADA